MIEKPSNGRAEIKQDFNTLTIEIPSKKNWFIIIFLTVWLGGWAMGEISVIKEIFYSDTPFSVNAFLLFWLAGWTVGGAFAFYAISWLLFGREIINIQRGILTLGKSVGGVGRKKKYEIRSIKNIDLNSVPDLEMRSGMYNSSIFGIKGGKIKFDYGMKTIKFANDIDDAEARVLIHKLKEDSNLDEENFT